MKNNNTTKKTEMVKFLKKFQKLQVNNFDKIAIWISSRYDKCSGYSINVTIFDPASTDSEHQSYSLYSFYSNAENNLTYESACNTILNYGGKI